MISKRALTAVHVLATLAVLGCSAAPETLSDEPLGTDEEAILDGSPTSSPTYGAVAALVVDIPEIQYYDVICSATLVAPQAAVTARHCTPWIDLALELGGTPYLAFGPSGWTPEQLVPITSYVARVAHAPGPVARRRPRRGRCLPRERTDRHRPGQARSLQEEHAR
jgi:hypothetical protein